MSCLSTCPPSWVALRSLRSPHSRPLTLQPPRLDRRSQAEFRRTRTAENPLHLVGFFTEWQKYLTLHEQQLAAAAKGDAAQAAAEEATRLGLSLSEETLEKVSTRSHGFDDLVKARPLTMLRAHRPLPTTTLPPPPTSPLLPPQLNAEQIAQLYELMHASKNVWMTQEELDAELTKRAEEEQAGEGEGTPDLRSAH